MADILDEVERAELRASMISPPPRYEPLHAGGASAFVVGIVLAAFAGLAGMDLDRYRFATVATLALGFALPYLYFWDQRRRHTNAFAEELQRLQKEREASSKVSN